MWSTWFLKSRADIRQRWLQAVVLAAMLMAGTAAITLAFTVDRSTLGVIDGVHERANSAHVWLYGDPAALSGAGERPEVEQAGQVFATLGGDLVYQGEVHEASIWGLTDAPTVAPGLLTDGRWPSPTEDNEVVIGAGLARNAEIGIGDRLLLVAPNSRAATLEVVGIATPTFRVPYPKQTPAAAFVSMRSIDGLAGQDATALSNAERAELVLSFGLGVRLLAPDAADQFVSGLTGLSATTWPDTRADFVQESAGPPTMLRVFALFAVLASGFVVAATITNHAMAQQREIGLLKAVGFTPRQTTTLLLAQMLAISVPAALLGMALGVLATPLFQWGVTDLVDAPAVRSVDLLTVVGVFAAVQALVVACALFPARRAGRTRIVDAIAMAPRQTGGGASLIASGADHLRLPQVVVVGVKDTFTRPMRSWMILAAIAVAAATLMMTFSFRHSIQRLTDDPALIGSKPYELQATRLGELAPARPGDVDIPTTVLSHEDSEALIANQPDIAAFVTDRLHVARVGDLDVLTRAIGGDVSAMGFVLTDGRLFAAANETVVGLGLAQTLGLAPGDQLVVEILPGEPSTLDIVGTYFADENDGVVLMYGFDTLQDLDPSVEPGAFDIRLAQGADLNTVLLDIVEASEGRLVVADLTREADANISEGRRLIAPMTLLGAGLALLAAANLLSSLVFSVRERTPEFGMLKAIGFTPWQVVTVVMVGVAPLALLGTLIGAPVGYWLIDLLMRSQAEAHQPSNIIVLPGAPWLLALAAIALAISFVGAFLPAVRAGRLGVSEALRSE
jgi:putative ABC transport system permease protein